MTLEWKKALREKRKYAIKSAKDRTAENFELKRKYRNIATRERRKAIRAYWHTQSQELNARPDKFYSTFKPFISNNTKESTAVSLKSEVKQNCEKSNGSSSSRRIPGHIREFRWLEPHFDHEMVFKTWQN